MLPKGDLIIYGLSSFIIIVCSCYPKTGPLKIQDNMYKQQVKSQEPWQLYDQQSNLKSIMYGIKLFYEKPNLDFGGVVSVVSLLQIV
jgi:hypothetical protein